MVGGPLTMSERYEVPFRTPGLEARCECGQLIAKVQDNGIELKCKRCKRIVLIPYTRIEGWATLSKSPY